MRSVSFWGKLTSGSRISASRSDLLKVPNMSINPYTRFFQNKILNNCIHLNKDQFRFKIVESPTCSLCSMYSETMDHIFVYCENSRCLYREIRLWTKSVRTTLPDLNIPNITLSVDSEKHSPAINFIPTVYKLLFFRSRSSGQILNPQVFIKQLKYYEIIQRKIARKRDRLTYNFKKWTNLLSIL